LLNEESSILKEINTLIIKGNYSKALEIISKHFSKHNQETIFDTELLLKKSKIHFSYAEYETCLILANKSLEISEKKKNSLLIIDSLQIMGEVYRELGQTEDLNIIVKQIEGQIDNLPNKKGKEEQKRRAEYYKLSGFLFTQKSDFSKVIASYQKSIAIFDQLNIKEKSAEVSSRLAYIYFMTGKREKGSIIFDAIKIQEKIGNREALIRSYLILVEVYLRYNEFEKSSLNLDKTFGLLEYFENKYLLGHANNLRGLHYYQEGNFSLALKSLNTSLRFLK